MDIRPVWLTEKQAQRSGLLLEWDAAPADAKEVVSTALWESLHDFPGKGVAFDRSLDAVLRALGMPCHD